MFTEQIAAMGARLREAGWEDGIAAAFEQLMGSCAATYSNRGTVNLPGVSFIQVAPQGQRADYTKIDFKHNTEINVPPTTPLRGALYWGIAEGSASEVADEWIVSVRACDDRFGGGLRGAPFNVYCNPTGGKEPSIESGDAIVYGWALKRRGGKDYVPVWVNTYQEYEEASDPGDPVTVCLLGCGTFDEDNCYVVPEFTISLPAGTDWSIGRRIRLVPCAGSPPSEPSEPSIPSQPSEPSWPSYPSPPTSPEEPPEPPPPTVIECGTCLHAGTDTTPAYLNVAPEGIVNGTCSSCDDLNYYLFMCSQAAANPCIYNSVTFNLCGDVAYFQTWIFVEDGHVQLLVMLNVEGQRAFWRKWLTGPGVTTLDCSSIDEWVSFDWQDVDFPCYCSGSRVHVMVN